MPNGTPSAHENVHGNQVTHHAEWLDWRHQRRWREAHNGMDDRPAVWGLDAMVMLAGASLAGVAAVMSICGLIVLCPEPAQPGCRTDLRCPAIRRARGSTSAGRGFSQRGRAVAILLCDGDKRWRELALVARSSKRRRDAAAPVPFSGAHRL
jgi:hypothetical protein